MAASESILEAPRHLVLREMVLPPGAAPARPAEILPPSEEQALATALEAFEDGLYLVIVDGQELRQLDQQVFLQPESRVTFVRLIMLAGG